MAMIRVGSVRTAAQFRQLIGPVVFFTAAVAALAVNL
jgi:hypothetical protein